VPEDPENVKQEFAFDNPAFKNDAAKVTASPLDTKWTAKLNGSNDKRKTVDDSFTNVPAPRLIALRGSDFTGLGIELCGGLKEGIYVKKVMSQGPGVGVVQAGKARRLINVHQPYLILASRFVCWNLVIKRFWFFCLILFCSLFVFPLRGFWLSLKNLINYFIQLCH
jgi:hypothetical protein